MDIIIFNKKDKTIKKYKIYSYDIINGSNYLIISQELTRHLREAYKQGSLKKVKLIFDSQVIFLFENTQIHIKNIHYYDYSNIQAYIKYNLYDFKLYSQHIKVFEYINNKIFKKYKI